MARTPDDVEQLFQAPLSGQPTLASAPPCLHLPGFVPSPPTSPAGVGIQHPRHTVDLASTVVTSVPTAAAAVPGPAAAQHRHHRLSLTNSSQEPATPSHLRPTAPDHTTFLRLPDGPPPRQSAISDEPQRQPAISDEPQRQQPGGLAPDVSAPVFVHHTNARDTPLSSRKRITLVPVSNGPLAPANAPGSDSDVTAAAASKTLCGDAAAVSTTSMPGGERSEASADGAVSGSSGSWSWDRRSGDLVEAGGGPSVAPDVGTDTGRDPHVEARCAAAYSRLMRDLDRCKSLARDAGWRLEWATLAARARAERQMSRRAG